MKPLVDEIHYCMANDRWYAAVALALTIPDVCATLMAPDNARKDRVKARYLAWCGKYLPDKGSTPEPIVFWELRSGVVHQAALNSKGFDRIAVCIETPGHKGAIHNLIFVDEAGFKTYVLSAREICHSLLEAGQKWIEQNRETPIVVKNYSRLMQRADIRPFVYFGSLPAFVSSVNPTQERPSP